MPTTTRQIDRKWKRHAHGYVSTDGQWFIERGGIMSHGGNAWIIFRLATDADIDTDEFGAYERRNGSPAVTFDNIAGLFIYCGDEGYLSDAKLAVDVYAE